MPPKFCLLSLVLRAAADAAGALVTCPCRAVGRARAASKRARENARTAVAIGRFVYNVARGEQGVIPYFPFPF